MKDKGALHDVYSRPGFLLKRCHQVSAAIFVELCRDFSMTPSQYGALCALHDFPDVDQIALGRLIGQDRSTVGLVLRLLTERGLIERSVNENDKRRMRLKLSKAGRRLLADIAPLTRQVQDAVLAGLPKEKRQLFLELLEEFLRGHDAVLHPEEIMAGRANGSAPGAVRSDRAASRKAGAPRRAAAADTAAAARAKRRSAANG